MGAKKKKKKNEKKKKQQKIRKMKKEQMRKSKSGTLAKKAKKWIKNYRTIRQFLLNYNYTYHYQFMHSVHSLQLISNVFHGRTCPEWIITNIIAPPGK